MKLTFIGFIFLSISNLCAQTFTFPHNEKECIVSARVCSTLLEIQKHIPVGVTVSSVEIQSQSLKIKGYSPGYKEIGIFIENLTKIVSIKGRMDITSTQPGLDTGKKRIENFQLKGKLTL